MKIRNHLSLPGIKITKNGDTGKVYPRFLKIKRFLL